MSFKGIEIVAVTDGYRVEFDYPLYFLTSTIIEAKKIINDWYAGVYDEM